MKTFPIIDQVSFCLLTQSALICPRPTGFRCNYRPPFLTPPLPSNRLCSQSHGVRRTQTGPDRRHSCAVAARPG